MTAITSISLTDSGEAYTSAPDVTIDLPTAPVSPAALGINLTSLRVSSIDVDSGGYYYQSTPSIAIDAPTAPIAPASFTVNMSSDRVNSLSIDSGGYYYLSAPTLTFDDPPVSENVVTSEAKFGIRSYKFRSSVTTNENIDIPTTYYNSGINTNLGFWVYSDTNWSSANDWQVIFGAQNGSIRNNDTTMVLTVAHNPSNPTTSTYNISNGLVDGWNYIVVRAFYNQIGPTQWATVYQVFRNGGFLINAYNGQALGSSGIPLINSTITLVNENDPGSGYFVDNSSAYIDDIAFRANASEPASSATWGVTFELDRATAVAFISNGRVFNTFITNDGSGYTSTPNLTVSAPTGTPSDFRAAAEVASLVESRITAVNITDSGGCYIATPDYTIDAPTGTPTDFRATATAILDNTTKKLSAINITDSGGGYITAPDITIAEPAGTDFIVGEQVTQTLPSGVVMSGEVAKYSDSDHKIQLIHVGADDGNYHTFTTDVIITGSTSGAVGTVTAVTEQNDISSNEQNDDFSTVTLDFLDFTEANPFGDPENN